MPKVSAMRVKRVGLAFAFTALTLAHADDVSEKLPAAFAGVL
jgi:hypothetical protein